MLKDCIEIFKELYDKKGEALINDSYILDEGTYILIDDNGQVKNKINVAKKNQDKTVEGYYDFCKLDYLSRLFDTQKPICNKIIHSNNYLSFFIKKENIKGKLTEEIIDNYYKILEEPRNKYKDKKKKNMYEVLERDIGKPNKEDIEKNKAWIKQNIFKLPDEITKGKNYLKIFFEKDIKQYKRESRRYVIPNVYNNTKYNEIINNILYGLPNNNMGLNSNKPYLKNKTRKNSIPYLISIEEVMIQQKFFDYLYNMACDKKNNIYISKNMSQKIVALQDDKNIKDEFNGFFLRIKKGKTEAEIHDFDTISNYKKHINDFIINQVIPLNLNINTKYENINIYNEEINDLMKVQNLVNILFFNKFLTPNYFTEPSDIGLKDFTIKKALLNSRNGFFNWFFKGNTNAIKAIFPKVSMNLIKNSIANSSFLRVREQFNLREAILDYLGGGRNMADVLSYVNDKLREKINAKETCKIENDEEYYFAVGQVANYLISLNKSSKKMHSLINPILNCKDDKRLKEQLLRLFKKYNYAIEKNSKRFNNLKAMILSYVPETKVNEEIVVAGYLYSSLIYEKNKEE